MNKNLREEELDRTLALEKHGPSFYDAVKVKICPKTLTFWPNDLNVHEDYKGRDEKVILRKSSNHGESLGIEVQWNEFTFSRCDLGHMHRNKEKQREYKAVHIDWVYVPQIIEWLQLGSWSEVKPGEPRGHKAIKEAIDFLDTIAAKEPIFKLEAKKISQKLKGFIHGE